ncbi:NUDIX domain-containing protein [Paenibacillus alkalitolerans]|uniref:NUDIX domain-containing protein n=1 Tax=Paenibacillus alkalitolerans TaxID=2799335 RepID=UPI00227808DE|nr:NUDIX domain-containing protein [Paenibacillus alkalitolerans]
MTAAFLSNNGKFLMLKKAGNKFYQEEFWSGLGGHIEAHEIKSPREACLREIFEESGISEVDVRNLKLKYVLLRLKEDEIRQQFVYFGETVAEEVIPSEEGELHWISINEIRKLHMSSIIGFMIDHYLQNPDIEHVMVGTLTVGHDHKPQIQWAELKDPIVF